MNIFRILAQGDGSINEPNVSAFLGYLLDPNEDHGLGSKFLEQFLQLHYNYEKFICKDENNKEKEIVIDNKKNLAWLVNNNDEGEVIDLSKNGDYEIKVFFEQAFAGEKGKQIVDIMLIVHEMPKGGKKEQYFKSYIKNEKELKHIFLIEVKISDSAAHATDVKKNKEGQLKQQVINSRNVLKDLLETNKDNFDVDKDISIVFVTPDIVDKSKLKSKEVTNAKKAFEEILKEYDDLKKKFKFESNPKSIIFWNSIRDNENNIINYESVEKLIDNIIYSVHEDKADPIPQYTIDTLKSFSNFIYSDFSYRYKRLPTFKPEVFDNLLDFKNKYRKTDLLNDESWNRINESEVPIKSLDDNIRIDFSKTHPMSVFYKGKKIFSLTTNSNNLNFQFVTRNFNLVFDESDKVKLNYFNCKYKETFPNKVGWPIYEFSNTNEVPLDVILEILSDILKKIK